MAIKYQKPESITDRQWEANPNIYHWEQSREVMMCHEPLRKQPNTTHEKIVADQRQMLVDGGLSTKDFDKLQNMHN